MPCASSIRADVNKGFLFDGRFSEDFKLASGTWASVGPLRSRILAISRHTSATS